MNNKKIAVFHNYMDNMGGAEIVGLTLARNLNADLYSTNVDYKKIEKMGFSDVYVNSIGKIPINAPLRQQIALARFRILDLSDKYDYFIIDGDWAMSSAVKNRPNLWYVHSPIREIWDLYKYTRKYNVPWYGRNIFDMWVYYNRYLNKKYSKYVGKVVCNSINTKNRVKKYLKLDAEVVYPPIDTSKYSFKNNGDYWLSVNRLITHKRVEMQLNAFEKLPEEKLVIIGSYEQSKHFRQYANYINKIKPDNVEILSWVDSAKLIELYSNCKGFITTSKEEDFGMTPVEAMASGKAVIAPNEGGYRETVLDGITGKLIDNIDSNKIVSSIKEIGSRLDSYKHECINQAKKFDIDIFIKSIKEKIDGN